MAILLLGWTHQVMLCIWLAANPAMPGSIKTTKQILKQPKRFGKFTLKVGTIVDMADDGFIKSATLKAPHKFAGVRIPAGSRIDVNVITGSVINVRTHYGFIVRLAELTKVHGIECSQWARVHFDTKHAMLIEIDARTSFAKVGVTNISGRILFYPEGRIKQIRCKQDGSYQYPLTFKGIKMSCGRIYFWPNGKPAKFTIRENHTFGKIPVLKGGCTGLHKNGRVAEAVLAEDMVLGGVPVEAGKRIIMNASGGYMKSFSKEPQACRIHYSKRITNERWEFSKRR